MKKHVLHCAVLLILSNLAIAGGASDPSSVGLKNRIPERTASILQGIFTLGHLGFNVMSAYFQTEQIKFLDHIPYPDNEPGVREEDKKCGLLCRENSAIMRSNAQTAANLDILATLTSATSALFNFVSFSIWSTMQANWEQRSEYKENVDKFAKVALGASVVNAYLNLGSITVLADTARYHIDQLTLKTTAPFQVAALTGVGYCLPMVLFAGYGLVKVSEFLEAAKGVTRQLYERIPNNRHPL